MAKHRASRLGRAPLRRSRGGLVATLIAALCLGSGLGLIGVALASQSPAPRMPPVTVVPEAAPVVTRETAAAPADSWLRLRAEAAALAEEALAASLPASKPVRLEIPAIGVDSVLQELGLAADGGLEVPAPGPHYNDAAWYRHSPTPGELGPAVLLGHIDSAAEGPSVFFRLGELEPGDRVAVSRADESTAAFTVDAVHRYPKDDFPTELVYGDIDHAGLRILSCGGAFDRAKRSYRDNIVVFASLIHGDLGDLGDPAPDPAPGDPAPVAARSQPSGRAR